LLKFKYNDHFYCFNVVVEFELEKGWALKSKQRFRIRGGGKCMTKNVKSHLEGYFLSGNINKSDQMTAKEMVSELQILANEGEIQVKEIPEVATVANWITRYVAGLKKLSAQKIEENTKNNPGDSAIVDDINVNEEEMGSEKDDSQELSEESNMHWKGKKTILNNDNSDNKHLIKRHKKE
jgi:hypothetical protein